ncbi:MAG TPA: hypothetical protein VEG24_00930, partial [Gaiellaceae bacterium]|nr:hypothetical protein [Gaiellaceae bacterium]
MVGRAASLLSRRRWTAFGALFACVVAWFLAAPHIPHPGLWPDIVIVSIAVMPVTLLLVLVLLPLHALPWRALLGTTL